jgi:alkylation response protein AidB-like acyl-CoA dehydrogenase
MPTLEDLNAHLVEIAEGWRQDRAERQRRRHLEQSDFDLLRDAGLLEIAVPEDQGGLWRSAAESTRTTSAAYRMLAAADPSVALVSSMHPAVVSFWLLCPDPSRPDWEEQRRAVFDSAAAGVQWGTIMSEPGSGGDVNKTKATARASNTASFLVGDTYTVSGDKHFGSGSGVTQRMITSAVPEGEDEPDVFVLDFDGRPWDGTAGLELIAEWDGMGMAATQSHSMRLVDAPAVRSRFPGSVETVATAVAPVSGSLFTAVILGVLDEAVSVARSQISARGEQLRAYEEVEWARAERDYWVAVQAHEGALRAIETGDPVAGLYANTRAKQAVADLAESILLRLARVLGGGTFSRRSPFSHWFEDVRALGFLRPPWGLSHDNLFATSLEEIRPE